MAGITPTGFENKTDSEILLSMLDRSKTPEYFGEYFPTSPDSKMGVLSRIISAAIKENWDGFGSIAAQQNRDTAEGKYLDDLAFLASLTRLRDSGSVGELRFTGPLGTLIPQSKQVQSLTTGKIVITTSSLFLTQSGCNLTNIEFELLPTTLYTLVINGIVYSYTSGAAPTYGEVIGGIIADIGTPDGYSAVQSGNYLKLTSLVRDNDISVGTTLNCGVFNVGLLVQAQSIDVGAIEFLAESLTTMIPTIENVTVTNPEAFTLGRLEETDAELRVRMSEKAENTGTATSPAIRASVSNIEGVTDVVIINNRTLLVDGDGRPPKSFQVYVDGGLEQVIAQTILDTQPAGIESYGSITRIVTNENGDPEPIKFSRMTDKYVWVKVRYTLNPEEVFPINGEDLIKQAIITKGNSLYKGEDLVASKFYGSVYSSTQGMYINTLEVAVTDLPSDTPVYTTAPITISRTTKLIFNTDRCDVSLL